jgi:hypothetical protein
MVHPGLIKYSSANITLFKRDPIHSITCQVFERTGCLSCTFPTPSSEPRHFRSHSISIFFSFLLSPISYPLLSLVQLDSRATTSRLHHRPSRASSLLTSHHRRGRGRASLPSLPVCHFCCHLLLVSRSRNIRLRERELSLHLYLPFKPGSRASLFLLGSQL